MNAEQPRSPLFSSNCRGLQLQPYIYLSATDEWYLLATENQRLSTIEHIVCATVSCQGKVFFVTYIMARDGQIAML